MLRIGLTGELGSGKSTVARLLAAHGAVVLSSDEMGRRLMAPGEAVYQAIREHFGPGVVLPDGQLDRPALAALAFDPQHPRVDELNALIHPAVLAAQEARIAEIARNHPDAVVVVESALLLTTRHAGPDPWRDRFDAVVLVTAPDTLKIQRFTQRVAAGRVLAAAQEAEVRADAERRLAAQRIPAASAARCLQLRNTGSLADLQARTAALWQQLHELGTTPADQ